MQNLYTRDDPKWLPKKGVTNLCFEINENVKWDVLSKSEQEFSSKNEVHHECV